MKWLIVVMLALIAPTGAHAQITYEQAEATTVVDAESLGDGWGLASERIGGSGSQPWDRQLIYYGPAGSSVVIEAHALDKSLSLLTMEFRQILVDWTVAAFDVAGDPSTVPVLNQSADVPIAAMSDAYRVEGQNPGTANAVGFALYGSFDHLIVVTVRVEGAVGGVTGVAATDYVAGLYFAALSA